MEVLDDLAGASLGQETIVTVGAFDGVHRGHQVLIGAVVERAQRAGLPSVVITFHPHPAAVLAPERAPRYLTTPGEKVALLEGLGVELVVLLPFDQKMAAMPARTFTQIVAGALHPRELWVGSDFALGREREGDIDCLRILGEELGFTLHTVGPVVDGDETISSSRIRALLREGRVVEVTPLLGRYPSLSGEVVVGAKRGRTLGFRTANLEVRPERAVPSDGVYAVFAVLGVERHKGVANLGIRPSFDNGLRTVETHILDFQQDIYGSDLVIEFVARLRDERRFENIDDLVAQIGQDSEDARRILEGTPLAAERERSDEIRAYRFVEINHTADRALEVWGRELPDLFAGAARGMYSLMADLDGLAANNWLELQLEGLDPESLLVDWLNELLFFTETEGLLFVDYQIESLTATELVARAGGVASPVTKAHIKAATFHDLNLVQAPDGWSAVLTLDV
jgi:riboflavin kinase/FMN adenylyltransferase